MSVIEDVRKVSHDGLAPELREIKTRLDGQGEQISADLRLSQRVEQIEKTLRQSSQQ